MKDLLEHKRAFEDIALKYGLKSEKKAGEVADFLTTSHGKKLSAKDFARKFDMSFDDAVVFLTFIQRGIQFKEKHVDNKQ